MDDYGVFLEELRKNHALTKKEEPREGEVLYGVDPNNFLQQNHCYPVDDDMSDYDGSDFERMSSPRSSEKGL